MTTTTTRPTTSAPPDLPVWRINLMRAGYLLMVVGLALVKWPLLGHAASLPLFEGVTLCLLTAMSLLALLGLRHPAKLLPVLLFEAAWKVLWLSLVALPAALSNDLTPAMTDVIINCTFVVAIVAVIPWRYAWRRYGRAHAEPWR